MARARTIGGDAATTRTFTAVIEPDEEEGGFVVSFPAIPDLATQGETLEEARQMAEECLRGYLEIIRETGRPLPRPGGTAPREAATIIEAEGLPGGSASRPDGQLSPGGCSGSARP
jgi:predicted RNase H-like HicB family nuclease